MKLIAFTGAMGSGKSTAIQYLKDTNLDKKIELIKFAGPLYDMQEYIYRRIDKVYKRPETFVKDRKLLQWIGTDWGRNTVGDDVWVRLWKEEVNYAAENYSHAIIVCDDCRFDNEAEAIKQAGGILVKIVSDKNYDRITTANGIPNHASESGVSKQLVDFVVENNDTLEAFKEKLDAIFDLTLNKDNKKE